MTSGPPPPTGLPAQLSSFVGRTRELEELVGLFAANRLVTLTGPGGSGKTRLALRFAESLGLEPADLQFVDLAQVTDPALLLGSIATALRIREVLGETLLETLARQLDGRDAVLVLDNLEQLPAAGPILAELLGAAGTLRVLATSRAPLHVRGEQEYPVNPLALPAPDDVASLERLAQIDAVNLFVERARAIDPAFELREENAAAIAEVCRRLDGLPLAIELAAYSTRLFSPASLLDRLERSLPLLAGGPADAPARQRALTATIAWSFDLLSDVDQHVFASLGVFVQGGTVGAAAAVIDDPASQRPLAELVASLEHLVDHNLLRVTQGTDAEPRFGMLETIREFAVRQLDDAELPVLRGRHLAHHLSLAEEADAGLRGPDQVRWIRQLVAESANVRAALAWAQASGNDASLARLAAALKRRFWFEAGGIREGLRWLELVLGGPAAMPPALRARALHRAGWMAAELGDVNRSRALFAESLEVAEEGDDANRFEALMGLGYMGLGAGARDPGDSEARLREAIAIARRGKVPGGALVESLLAQGHMAKSQGNGPLARAHFAEAAAAAREIGDAWGIASALHWLGGEELAAGDSERARVSLAESARLAAEIGDKEVLVYATLGGARALTGLGQLEAARRQLRDAADLIARFRSYDQRLVLLVSAAGWLAAASDLPAAVEAWATAAKGREGDFWLVQQEEERANRAGRDAARRALGSARFETLSAAGQARNLDEAVRLSMAAVDGVDLERVTQMPAPVARGRFELTPRETEVLALVASGMSDGDIAEALFISKKTASVHVASIKGKLGASSRVEIARIALGHAAHPSEG